MENDVARTKIRLLGLGEPPPPPALHIDQRPKGPEGAGSSGVCPEKYQKGGWGGGSATQKCVYQKCPDQIFPTVNFAVSHDGPLGLGGGGGQRSTQ